MSEIFDIEAFSQKAQSLKETLEKADLYLKDIDGVMTQFHENVGAVITKFQEDTGGTEIRSRMEEYEKQLTEMDQKCRSLLELLNDEPKALKDSAVRLKEAAEQWGDSKTYMEQFQEQGKHLIELFENIGNLEELQQKLTAYEEEMAKAEAVLTEIKQKQSELQKVTVLMQEVKKSVAGFQEQHQAAVDELKENIEEATEKAESIKDTFQKNEDLQLELQGQVKFFKIGIYAMIVMNTLMMVFLAVFLVKEIFFSA